MDKILVILGPTATGKTDLALSLAKKHNGELVACDSRQVYKGLDLGTGKMPGRKAQIKKGDGYWIIDGIKIWMYDVADVWIQFTVKDYVDKAEPIIQDILKRNKLPIIVGGTGLYLTAIIKGLTYLKIPINLKIREELYSLSLEQLQKLLQKQVPDRWVQLNQSDRQNKRRLIRAIEISYMYPYILQDQNLKSKDQKYNYLKIGLTAPREILNNRIDLRVIYRINQGMIDEAKKLHEKGISFERMRQLGLEYGVLAEYLEGKLTQEQFIEKLKIKIHQYAKRQITWFKKEKDIHWFDITVPSFIKDVENLIYIWYYSTDDKIQN